MPVDVMERQEEFIQKIIDLISHDKLQDAISEIVSLNKIEDQLLSLGVLASIVAELVSNSDAKIITMASARTLRSVLSVPRAYISDLEGAWALAKNLSRFISREISDSVIRRSLIPLDLDGARKILDVVTEVLGSILGLQSFVLTGYPLTPFTLVNEFAPYVNAMAEIQAVLSEMQSQQDTKPKIEFIMSGSAIFSVTGFAGIVAPLINWLRFGKKQTEEMDLRNEHLKLKNEHQHLVNQATRLELETSKRQYLIDNDPALNEIERQAKIEEIRIERKNKRLALRKEELELEERELALLEQKLLLTQKAANDFLSPFFPEDMPLHERAEYVVRIIPHLQTIINSPLTLRSRPTTLPEEFDDSD